MQPLAFILFALAPTTAPAPPLPPPTQPATLPAATQPLTSPQFWAQRAAKEAAGMTDPGLLARLGLGQLRCGDTDAFARTIAQAEREAARIPDAKAQCNAYLAIAESFAEAGDRDGYARGIAAAQRYPERAADMVDRATAYHYIAIVQANARDSAGWRGTVEKVADPYFRADVCLAVATALGAGADKQAYIEASRLAEQAAGAVSAPATRDSLLHHLASVHGSAGNYGLAATLAVSIQDKTWRAMACLAIAAHQIKAGDLGSAGSSVAMARGIPIGQMTWGEMQVLTTLARAEAGVGNKQGCAMALKRAKDQADAYLNPQKKAAAFIELAAAQLRLGDKAAAIESIKAAEAARAAMPTTGPVQLDSLPEKYSALARAQAASGELAAALATAKAVAQAEMRLLAYAQMARELADAGRFEEAGSLIPDIADADARAQAVRTIASAHAKGGDLSRLRQWMESLPTSWDRAEACIEVVKNLRPLLPRQP